MSTLASAGRLLVAIVATAVFTFAQAAGEDNAFMPKGGRVLLLELLGAPPDPTELRAIAQARRTEPEWLDFVTARKKSLTERELATLAAYLAVNMPLSDEVVKRDKLASALPPDGRELSLAVRQSLDAKTSCAGVAQHVPVAVPSRVGHEPAGT